MRFTVDVSTMYRDVDEIKAEVLSKIDKIIDEAAGTCLYCKKPFLSERRTRKKFCDPKCKALWGNRHLVRKYGEKPETDEEREARERKERIERKRRMRERLEAANRINERHKTDPVFQKKEAVHKTTVHEDDRPAHIDTRNTKIDPSAEK